MHPVPLDEYPIHQAPVSLRHVASSDRNFYDRSYFNAHDRTGDLFFVTGLGVYPNLGVVDAYATVRKGERQWTIRCSDALGNERLAPGVGPYRIEVVEPLRRIRLVCDGDDHGLGFDLQWEGSFPPVMEQPHVMRAGPRAILDASRFAQVGTWEGVLRIADDEVPVSPDVWVGTRDRSWGIRPVGEGEPTGRPGTIPPPGCGGCTSRCGSTTSPSSSSSRRTLTATARSTTPPACGPTAASTSWAGQRWRSPTGPAPGCPSGPRFA